MKLTEILVESKEILDEDFGNLNFLDRKFDKAFKIASQRRVPYDSENGYQHKTVYAAPPRVGQNSEVITVPFKTNSSSINTLEDNDVIATVFTANDEQMFLIRAVPGQKFKDPTTYNISFDITSILSVYDSTFPEDASVMEENEAIVKEIGLIFGTTEKIPAPVKLIRGKVRKIGAASSMRVPATIKDVETKNVTSGPLQKFTGFILKTFKAKKIDLEMKIIKADDTREKTKSSRNNQRRGMIPAGELTGAFMKNAKLLLKTRLDAFKSTKAVGVDKIEDLVAAIREKGYLEKLRVQGFAYDQKRSRIEIETLRKPNKGEFAYVEYEMNEHTPEYKKFQKEMDELYNIEDKDERKNALAEFSAKVPPKRFKVILKLEKGTIVPAEIMDEKSYYDY